MSELTSHTNSVKKEELEYQTVSHPPLSRKNVTFAGKDTAVTEKCMAYRVFMAVRAEPRDNRRIKRKRQVKDPSHDKGRRR